MSLPPLRAPQKHGQILAVPSLDQFGDLLERNRTLFDSVTAPVFGRPLRDLRRLAQREILTASAAYHQEAGESVAETAGDVWLVAGHQPELFHPGVWFKNFVLNQLAQKHCGISLNLIVDNDTVKPALLHVPSDGRLTRMPFDRSTLESPYEERVVEDEVTFASVPTRIKEITSRWNFEPLFESFWCEVMQQAKRTPLLGERFAAARRTIERRWGCVQRELPMSRVCQTEAFAWFACTIVNDLSTFHAAYNRTVQEYRNAHGIRSRSHPVPDLAKQGDWLEAPFWAWRTGQQRRNKLFVQSRPEVWRLRVNDEEWPSLSRTDAVGAWRSLETRGFKIRSRALTTTMFARLFLADVFIHGIGGGIYDELTDRLIERYFAIPAPGFLVVSATLLLPLPRYPEAAGQARQLDRQLRDLIYKPERFAQGNGDLERLTAAKRAWIQRECPTHLERVERFHKIRELNSALQPRVKAQIHQLQTDLAVRQQQVESTAVNGRRDYPFCLYPEEMLKAFFTKECAH